MTVVRFCNPKSLLERLCQEIDQSTFCSPKAREVFIKSLFPPFEPDGIAGPYVTKLMGLEVSGYSFPRLLIWFLMNQKKKLSHMLFSLASVRKSCLT